MTADLESSNTALPFATASTNGASPNQTGSSGGAGLTWSQVENYWIQAGGSPQAASMAAAVATASSGLDPAITRSNPDGTTSVGLWLIPKNGQPPGSTDPLANARAAKELSQNGTDWSQWCVTWSDNNCGQDGGSYLGEGSNALGALGSTNQAYNQFGSAPAGSGTGASSATSASSTTGAPTGSKAHTVLLFGLGIIVIAAIYLFIRSRRVAEPAPVEVEQPPA